MSTSFNMNLCSLIKCVIYIIINMVCIYMNNIIYNYIVSCNVVIYEYIVVSNIFIYNVLVFSNVLIECIRVHMVCLDS